MIVKLLTERHLEFLSLKGGCRGSSESTLVKMSNCWKSHALAQITIFFGHVFDFSKSIQSFAFFTIGMIGNDTGHLLECVELYGKFINKFKTKNMLKGNIAASLLKVLWKTLYSGKYYDKSNMNVH